MWNLNELPTTAEAQERKRDIRAVKMAPDSNIAAVVFKDDALVVHELNDGMSRYELEPPGTDFEYMAFSSDYTRLHVQLSNGTRREWFKNCGNAQRDRQGPWRSVSRDKESAGAEAVAHSESPLMPGAGDGPADLSVISWCARCSPEPDLAPFLVAELKRNWAVAEHAARRMRERLESTLAEQYTSDTSGGYLPSVAIVTKDARHTLLGFRGGKVVLGEIETDRPLQILGDAGSCVTCIAVDSSLRNVFTASEDRTIRLWVLGAEGVQVATTLDDDIKEIAVTRDGRHLWACLASGEIHVLMLE